MFRSAGRITNVSRCVALSNWLRPKVASSRNLASNLGNSSRPLYLKQHNKLFKVHISNVTSFETQKECALEKSDIEKLIAKYPQLHFVEVKNWKSLTNILSSNGFQIEEIKDIFDREPKILELNPTSVQNSLTVLRDLHLGESNLIKLLHTHPVLFLLKPSSFSSRYKQLDACFPHKEVRKIIKDTPEVLFEDWGCIMNKIQYILFKMGLEQDDIVKAKALKHPIEYIKLRHQLLEKTGFYVKPTPKTKKMSKNLSLKDILNLSDYHLCKYCHVTREEYYILGTLLEEEESEEFYSDSDFDSDSETN